MEKENAVEQQATETQVEASTQETETKENTFTQEQVNNFLAKEKAKWQKQAEAEKEEAKKLAKMNADEKANYEFEKRENALLEREKALQTKELQAEARSMLSEKGLPTELHELLNYENAESVKKGVDTLEKAIQKAVENAVNERLKGTVPQKGNTNNATSSLEDEVKKVMGIK